jgi:hypothetical protein
MPPRRISHTRRFLSHIGEPDSNGCWPWKSTVDVYGYGIFSIRQHPLKAHRYSYEYFIEAIPPELTVDHPVSK